MNQNEVGVIILALGLILDKLVTVLSYFKVHVSFIDRLVPYLLMAGGTIKLFLGGGA